MSLIAYRSRQLQQITAVQLRLDFAGFYYNKWNGSQNCKPGDWLVDCLGDVYTIDQDSFAETYEEVSSGRYVKRAIVWAEQAAKSGSIRTKEGSTKYSAGDWLVYNDPDREDGYAVSEEEFLRRYEPDD